MSRTSDAIIIGAGVMGCSCAHRLAQRGLTVTVLEKGGMGEGSTGKSSAMIRQHYSNELTARMALDGLRAFERMEDELGEDVGFTRTGFLALVAQRDAAGLEANVALQRSVGIRADVLPPEALRELMPGLVTSDLVAGAYEPEAGYADPHMTVNALAGAARRHGASIHLHAPVVGVRMSGETVVGVDTPGDRYDAPVVVNCAGPWGASVGRLSGVELPIDACRAQIAFFGHAEAGAAEHPMVLDFIHATYFRPETGGLTLAGSIDPAEADDVIDPEDYNELQDDSFTMDVGEKMLRRYEPMRTSHPTGGYAGAYAVTPDWHPIIDEVPAGSGLYVCAGFSGHGFKLAPAIGIMVADLITGASDPRYPAAPFRLDRYARDALIKGQYEYSITG